MIERPFGHADTYVADHVALIGDAAHPVTPAGGQGANMSVADAMVLADVADEALKKNDCSKKQLARYEEIRKPANSRSLQFSQRGALAFQFLKTFPFLAPLLPWFLTRVNLNPDAKVRLMKNVSQAFQTTSASQTTLNNMEICAPGISAGP